MSQISQSIEAPVAVAPEKSHDLFKERTKTLLKWLGTAAVGFGTLALGTGLIDGAIAHWDQIPAPESVGVGGGITGVGICLLGIAGVGYSTEEAPAGTVVE